MPTVGKEKFRTKEGLPLEIEIKWLRVRGFYVVMPQAVIAGMNDEDLKTFGVTVSKDQSFVLGSNYDDALEKAKKAIDFVGAHASNVVTTEWIEVMLSCKGDTVRQQSWRDGNNIELRFGFRKMWRVDNGKRFSMYYKDPASEKSAGQLMDELGNKNRSYAMSEFNEKGRKYIPWTAESEAKLEAFRLAFDRIVTGIDQMFGGEKLSNLQEAVDSITTKLLTA